MVVHVEQDREPEIVADLIERPHLGMIDRQAGLVLAESLGTLVHILLEHRAQAGAAASIGRSRIDAAKRHQPVGKSFCRLERLLGQVEVARRFGRNQRQDDGLRHMMCVHPLHQSVGRQRRVAGPGPADVRVDVDVRAVGTGGARARRRSRPVRSRRQSPSRPPVQETLFDSRRIGPSMILDSGHAAGEG